VVDQANAQGKPLEFKHAPVNLPAGILATVLGCVLVYSALFGTGYCLYGEWPLGIGLLVLSAAAGYGIARLWPRLRESQPDAGN